MGKTIYDHFCLMIFGQDKWKEKTAESIEDLVKDRFFYYAGHSECETCSTCPICSAIVDLFDPMHPGEYHEVCDLCKAFYNMLKVIQNNNDGLILHSHSLFYEINSIIPLVNALLASEKIKKIYIMEVYNDGKRTSPSIVLKEIEHLRIKRAEFIEIINSRKFQRKILYEIYKDQY